MDDQIVESSNKPQLTPLIRRCCADHVGDWRPQHPQDGPVSRPRTGQPGVRSCRPSDFGSSLDDGGSTGARSARASANAGLGEPLVSFCPVAVF
eukprot:s1775_g4.t1